MAGFNLRTYKGLAKQTNLILSRIEKSGLIGVSAVEKLKNNLANFWEKRGKKSPTKSGISFNKRMTAEDKREMAQILRSFIREPRKTPEEIREEYEEKIAEYLKDLSPKYQEKFKNKSENDMYMDLERIDRVLKSRKIIESLGSDVVNQIYKRSKDMGLNGETMATAIYNAMENGALDNFHNTPEDFEIVFDNILDEYDNLINEV